MRRTFRASVPAREDEDLAEQYAYGHTRVTAEQVNPHFRLADKHLGRLLQCRRAPERAGARER